MALEGGAGEPAAPIDFELGPVEPNGTRRLSVDFHDPDGSGQTLILQPVQGGFSRRWYAGCPRQCGRRGRKLYLVRGRFELACVRCCGLQYRSAQEHDKRLDQARREPAGFYEEREKHTSFRSRLVTAFLTLRAAEKMAQPQRGRGWGRKSFTSYKRARRDLLEDLGTAS